MTIPTSYHDFMGTITVTIHAYIHIDNSDTQQMHNQLTCIHANHIPRTTPLTSTWKHDRNNDHHHAYTSSTYTTYMHAWQTHYAHPVQGVNFALIPLCGIRYHQKRLETKHHPKRMELTLIPLSMTLLPHLPKIIIPLGKYVMKSYYDMVWPPRSP